MIATSTTPIGGPTQAVAAVTFGAIVVVFAADLVSVRIATGRFQVGAIAGSRRDRSYNLIQLFTLCGLLVAVTAPRFAPRMQLQGSPWMWVGVGLTLTAAGLVIRVWAVLTLGRAFNREVQVAAHQELVTAGPYRFVRHPSYTGVLLAFLGIGVMIGNLVSVVALLVLPAIGYVARIRTEERMLRREMGERYASYAEGRPRLVPGVW